jgi:hypothetical protein
VFEKVEEPPHAALFHNNHDGTFTDVAAKAGVTNDRWGFGVTIGDFDNDGWPDIFVANYGKNRLYHNNHDGTFTDVAEKAGVTLGGWSSGATWGDYDGDGRLDLFVAGYVHFDRDNLPVSGSKAVGFSTCQYRGATVMCGPRGLKGEPDHLFYNNGDGSFTDVSVRAGVDDKDRFYGFESIFVDVNGDGKPDLLVGNDSEPNFFYINKGDGTFEDQGYISGFALNKDGREIASMGIAVGDYENSGELDFAVTDFSDDYKVLFRNSGDATLTDVSYAAGIAQTSIPFVGLGDGFIDYDNIRPSVVVAIEERHARAHGLDQILARGVWRLVQKMDAGLLRDLNEIARDGGGRSSLNRWMRFLLRHLCAFAHNRGAT